MRFKIVRQKMVKTFEGDVFKKKTHNPEMLIRVMAHSMKIEWMFGLSYRDFIVVLKIAFCEYRKGDADASSIYRNGLYRDLLK